MSNNMKRELLKTFKKIFGKGYKKPEEREITYLLPIGELLVKRFGGIIYERI